MSITGNNDDGAVADNSHGQFSGNFYFHTQGLVGLGRTSQYYVIENAL